MNRDPILEQLIPVRLWELLKMMHSRHRHWKPDLTFPDHSAGLSSGGSVSISSLEDFEEECDAHALAVTETAYDGLPPQHRLAIDIAMAWMPRVWQGRISLEELIEDGVDMMRAKMLTGGVAV